MCYSNCSSHFSGIQKIFKPKLVVVLGDDEGWVMRLIGFLNAILENNFFLYELHFVSMYIMTSFFFSLCNFSR